LIAMANDKVELANHEIDLLNAQVRLWQSLLEKLDI